MFQFIFVFLKKGGRVVACPVRHRAVRQEGVQRLRDNALVNQSARNPHGAGHVQLVRVKQNLCLGTLGLVIFAVAVGLDTLSDLLCVFGIKAVFCQKQKCLFASHCRMAEGRVFKLFFPPDIVQQTGGDQDVVIHIFQCFSDFQRIIQNAVDMLLVVGAVIHAGQHIVFQ